MKNLHELLPNYLVTDRYYDGEICNKCIHQKIVHTIYGEQMQINPDEPCRDCYVSLNKFLVKNFKERKNENNT